KNEISCLVGNASVCDTSPDVFSGYLHPGNQSATGVRNSSAQRSIDLGQSWSGCKKQQYRNCNDLFFHYVLPPTFRRLEIIICASCSPEGTRKYFGKNDAGDVALRRSVTLPLESGFETY